MPLWIYIYERKEKSIERTDKLNENCITTNDNNGDNFIAMQCENEKEIKKKKTCVLNRIPQIVMNGTHILLLRYYETNNK